MCKNLKQISDFAPGGTASFKCSIIYISSYQYLLFWVGKSLFDLTLLIIQPQQVKSDNSSSCGERHILDLLSARFIKIKTIARGEVNLWMLPLEFLGKSAVLKKRFK